MKVVYILWHSYEESEVEDSKLIGVYSTIENAEIARDKLVTKPGFSSHPNGFLIDKYQLDQDHWTSGFGW
ncbi:hypothetical protein [Alteromonas sp. W364]|uniref:DUF7336 domain-containing protein n=1 Tax=Alteromonas sp. W364 TaxID=3075610 RepID=UPI002888F500|nr:hypothetical protein [Alteromonas sp. W364]MDT0629954.1 hypothetical protein [Alteromonas sp. W364]